MKNTFLCFATLIAAFIPLSAICQISSSSSSFRFPLSSGPSYLDTMTAKVESTSLFQDSYSQSRVSNRTVLEVVSVAKPREKTEAEIRNYYRDAYGLTGEQLDQATRLNRAADHAAATWITKVAEATDNDIDFARLAHGADELRLAQLRFEVQLRVRGLQDFKYIADDFGKTIDKLGG